MRPSGFLTFLFFSLIAAAPAMAADALFQLSGINSKNEAISVEVTRALAEETGLTEIFTKVVSLGEETRKVKGIPARRLLERFDLMGDNLEIVAIDGYAIDVPRADIDNFPTIIALEIDGRPLTVRDKGPAWLIYPVSGFAELDSPEFAARSVWQIKSVKLGSAKGAN
jgi:hypothetical protein